MSDSTLAALQRASTLNPDDEKLRYRFRLECVRAGQPERAGLEEGDFAGLLPHYSKDGIGTRVWIKAKTFVKERGGFVFGVGYLYPDGRDAGSSYWWAANELTLLEPAKPSEAA